MWIQYCRKLAIESGYLRCCKIDFSIESGGNNMVYVSWADADDEEVSVVNFATMEEAKEFVKDNNLSDVADINAMDW